MAVDRRALLDGLVREFAELTRDPEAWSEEQVQRESWEGTLSDGLEGA